MDVMNTQLLQASFTRLFACKAIVTERFYYHLFDQLPEVKPLFRNNFSRQRDMFEAMLARSIRELATPGGVTGFADALVKTHSNLQLTTHQVDTGGKALFLAIKDAIGDNLSAEELAAWERAISQLALSMKTSCVKQVNSI